MNILYFIVVLIVVFNCYSGAGSSCIGVIDLDNIVDPRVNAQSRRDIPRLQSEDGDDSDKQDKERFVASRIRNSKKSEDQV